MKNVYQVELPRIQLAPKKLTKFQSLSAFTLDYFHHVVWENRNLTTGYPSHSGFCISVEFS